MKTVNQSSALPTRKLTAAMLGASGAALVKAFVVHNWPYLSDPLIWEPLPIVVGLAAGYFVKDRPNHGGGR